MPEQKHAYAADYLPPHLLEFYHTVLKIHGPNSDDVFRQYQVMAEKCPLVLRDLERYCFGRESTHVAGDSHASAVNEGMRVAYLRVEALASLDDATAARLKEQYEEMTKAKATNERGKRQRDMDRRLAADYGTDSEEGETS